MLLFQSSQFTNDCQKDYCYNLISIDSRFRKKIAVIVGDVNGHVGGSAEDFEDHEGGDFENRSGVENSFTYMVLV